MTPVGAETFDDEKTDEWRARIGRGVPIAELVIGDDLRLQVEGVYDPPAAGPLGAEPVEAIVRVEPECAHLGAMFVPVASGNGASIRQAPNPTSARNGPSGRSTLINMCSRGPSGESGGDIQRTRAPSPVVLKPTASSAVLNRAFCSKQ